MSVMPGCAAWNAATTLAIASFHSGCSIHRSRVTGPPDVVAAVEQQLKAHAQALAAQAGRPYRHLLARERMEENARALAAKDGITDGLVCVYGTMETCRTFRVCFDENGPKVRPDLRVCKVLYFYQMDREFGLLHV